MLGIIIEHENLMHVLLCILQGGLMLIYMCAVPNLPSLPEETPYDANINIEKSKDDNKTSESTENQNYV